MAKTVLQQYREFHDLYARAHHQLSKSQAHDEANLKWNSMKKNGVLDQEAYKLEISALNSKLMKRKLTMFDFSNNRKVPRVGSSSSSNKPPEPSPSTSSSSSSSSSAAPAAPESSVTAPDLATPTTETEAGRTAEDLSETVEDDLEENELPTTTDAAVRDTPAQDKIKNDLNEVNSLLVRLNEARNLGLGGETNAGFVKQIKDATAKKDSLQKKLNKIEQWRKASKKARDKKKSSIKQAEKDFPGLSERVKSSIYRESPGRPCLEEQFPNLHRDLLEIAAIGAAASDRRREEAFRTVKTLNDLHKALSDLGYQISSRSLYNRLLPKGHSASEAKRHVKTVPVR